ncbi:MAG: hypothetical protein JW737_10085 [Acidobacteria bacterium]|nr:hypothetical protein [Acidobacteriota bacterium]
MRGKCEFCEQIDEGQYFHAYSTPSYFYTLILESEAHKSDLKNTSITDWGEKFFCNKCLRNTKKEIRKGKSFSFIFFLIFLFAWFILRSLIFAKEAPIFKPLTLIFFIILGIILITKNLKDRPLFRKNQNINQDQENLASITSDEEDLYSAVCQVARKSLSRPGEDIEFFTEETMRLFKHYYPQLKIVKVDLEK